MNKQIITLDECKKKLAWKGAGKVPVALLTLFIWLWMGAGAMAQIPINIVTPGSSNPPYYTVAGGVVTILKSDESYIINGGATTTNRIVVAAGVVADITLINVNIDVHTTVGACAFKIDPGANVNLILAASSTNSFISGGGEAGIRVSNGATLKVSGPNSATLIATGGNGSNSDNYGSGAGIGGFDCFLRIFRDIIYTIQNKMRVIRGVNIIKKYN